MCWLFTGVALFRELDARSSLRQRVSMEDASTGTLRKTSRLGNPVIVFAQPLCRRSLLLELQLEHLPTVGGIQVGVLRDAPYSANGEVLHWFDGAGRVNSRDGSNDFIVSLFGERLRSGDKLGVCYLAAERAILSFILKTGLTRC